MKRFMIQAEEELIARARDMAHRRGVSLAQVVRDALEKELGVPARPRPRIIGAFPSGKRDLARQASDTSEYQPPPWR